MKYVKTLEQFIAASESSDYLEAELYERAYDKDQRETLANKGFALPNGGYPIADVHDLKNAIKAIGRAGDREATLKHIIKRAKDLGRDKLLPKHWPGVK